MYILNNNDYRHAIGNDDDGDDNDTDNEDNCYQIPDKQALFTVHVGIYFDFLKSSSFYRFCAIYCIPIAHAM